MRLYLAGPMKGYADNNRAAFNAAAKRLRALGFEVVNPAELDDSHPEPEEYTDYYKRDIPFLLTCSAVAVLPGWRKSTGATIETYLARVLGFPVFDAKTMEVIPVELLPVAVHPTEGR